MERQIGAVTWNFKESGDPEMRQWSFDRNTGAFSCLSRMKYTVVKLGKMKHTTQEGVFLSR